jgi:type IV secretory pathway VirB2 component (pilin)
MRKITSILSRIFFAFLFFQTTFGNVAFATTSGAACGFTATCDKGMVCIGSTGIANDGQCTLMPIVVSMCTIFNWIQDYSTYFMIFAVVALGFAFFLGKISWGMIISVVLGIAVIKGATLITQKTTGVSTNYCSAASMQSSQSCTNAKWVLNTDQSKIGSNLQYNIDITDLCPQAMQCSKQTCTPYNRWGAQSNGAFQNTPTLNDVNTERTNNGLQSVTSLSGTYKLRAGSNITPVTQISTYSGFVPNGEVYYIYTEVADIPPASLSVAFKLYMQCAPTPLSSTQNFLVCTNSCTGNTQTVQSTSATTCAAAGLV